MSEQTLARCVVLAAALAIVKPLACYAQGFLPREQYGTLSFGAARTSIHPPVFAWIDDKFPAGLALPTREHGVLMEISAGQMVATRLAIVIGVELIGNNQYVGLANIHLYGGARSWLAKRLWVEGGLGPAWLSVHMGEGTGQPESTRWGFGVVGIVGYDLVQRRNASFLTQGHFMLQVQGRLSSNAAGGVRANSMALLLGSAIGW